jgi:hypothetical protein
LRSVSRIEDEDRERGRKKRRRVKAVVAACQPAKKKKRRGKKRSLPHSTAVVPPSINLADVAATAAAGQ